MGAVTQVDRPATCTDFLRSCALFTRKNFRLTVLLLTVSSVSLVCMAEEKSSEGSRATVEKDGRVLVPQMEVPLSPYMSEEARLAFIKSTEPTPGPKFDPAHASDEQKRVYNDDLFRPLVERARAKYPVRISQQIVAGVKVDIVEPASGVSPARRKRVLINLHGGGFEHASNGMSRIVEAIPVAGCTGLKVISIDYRLSPENKYPAAVQDVLAVYKALLKHYKARNIGIYGSSTGAALTGMTVAWLQKERLPLPGAVGLFFEGAIADQVEGDSHYIGLALIGETIPGPDEPFPTSPYMAEADQHDPLVAPIVSQDVMSRFPPTLLLSGTRDLGLSSVLYTDSRLVRGGVETDLHVWDGMWHFFIGDVTLPESREAFEVIARFFKRHLH